MKNKLVRVCIYFLILIIMVLYGNYFLSTKYILSYDLSNIEKYRDIKLTGFIELKAKQITDNGFIGYYKNQKVFFVGNNKGLSPGDICEISGKLVKPYIIKYNNKIIIYKKWKRTFQIFISILTIIIIFFITIAKRKYFIKNA